MAKTFLLEIITPDKIAFSDKVIMITASSADGVIGILSGHVPLFSRLIEGEIKIIGESGEFYLAIGSGFLEVTKEKTIILVTSAYHTDEINEQEVLIAQKRAQEALIAKPVGEALLEAQSLFRRSVIALKVLHRRKTRERIIQSEV